MVSTNLTALLSTLITSNHILHYHNILDAYGHVSVRNPNNASTFFLARQLAPALVSSPADINEYYVSSGEAVNSSDPAGYAERYIHSEILKRFPQVNSVVHSHSEDVIPYGIAGVDVRPSYHMAGFLGSKVPVFEIEQYYNNSQVHDMLVSTNPLGAALASLFANSSSSNAPTNTLVVMRGHGFATIGANLTESTFRAYFAASNGRVQRKALTLAALAAKDGELGHTDGVRYLDMREQADTSVMNDWSSSKPWAMWVREVEVNPLYVNTLGTPPV